MAQKLQKSTEELQEMPKGEVEMWMAVAVAAVDLGPLFYTPLVLAL